MDHRKSLVRELVAEALRKGMLSISDVDLHVKELLEVSPSVFFHIQDKVKGFNPDIDEPWTDIAIQVVLDDK